MQVMKRNGELELICNDKITNVVAWACEGLSNVSVSNVVMNAKLQFFDGITTKAIHESLVKSAANLISEFDPDYQYVAGRLLMTYLRKEAFGEHTPPDFYTHVSKLVEGGKYDPELVTKYNKEEVDLLGRFIDHEIDMEYTYSAMQQWRGKYLVQDRTKKEVFESPQQAIMLIGMCLFQEYPKTERKKQIKAFYKAVANRKISLPTPIMAGVRTPTRQFSSCTKIEVGDTLDSINGAANAIINYVSQRAGIGINAGAIRALKSPIRGGEAFHTGCIPFFKHFESAVKSCSQGGVRNGAATLFYPFWHKDVESFLVLKNNKGSDDNRVRHLDYAIQLNGFFFGKVLKGEDINLFCPNEAKGLYQAFFADQKLFEELYNKYSESSISRKTVKALDLMGSLVQERSSTGRVYIQFVDNCNNGPFDSSVAPIRQSNLCLEVSLPTEPLSARDENEGEIALCTLAAFNLGEVTLGELPEVAEVIVRALDSLLDYQDYPVKAAEKSKFRRALGVGVVNYAYWLAKNNAKYSDGSGNNITHTLFENIQYSLLLASNKLAEEKGACKLFGDSLYSQGKLPTDWYNKAVDGLVDVELTCDWDSLRCKIAKYGLRNSTLTALMPAETSSQISNSTNGIEPIKGLTSTKASKEGRAKQVVPDVQELFSKYETCWEMPSNTGYIQLCAIMQKFVDQAISANTYYIPSNYERSLVPFKLIVGDILTAYKLGLKTLYYHNTRDGSGEEMKDSCESGACSI